MNSKTYIVRRDTLKEALDHLEEFMDKMDNFISKHSEYKYNVSIREIQTKRKFSNWEIQTNIIRHEQHKNKSSPRTT